MRFELTRRREYANALDATSGVGSRRTYGTRFATVRSISLRLGGLIMRMILVLSTLAVLHVAGCGGSSASTEPESPQQGPMEKAGAAVDEAAEDTEQGVEDAVDKSGDAIGEAGESVDSATEDEN
jgi:hypothetical protein